MNGNGELTETEDVIFLRKLWSSYGILTYFATDNGDTGTEERIRKDGNHE